VAVSPPQAPAKLAVEWQARLGYLPVVAYGAGSVWAASVAPPQDVRGQLVRFDARTGKRIATFPVGWWPAQIMVGAGGVWVADTVGDGSRLAHRGPYDSGPIAGLADAVSRIDPRTNRVVATIHLPGIQSIAVGGGSVWTTSATGSYRHELISRIDPAGNNVTPLLTLRGGPGPLVWGHGHLWALTRTRLSEIDSRTGRVIASLVLPDTGPFGGLAYRAGLLLVVGDSADVFWVRTTPSLALARKEVVPWANDIATAGRNLWVAAGNESLQLLDAKTGARRARIALRGWISPTANVLAAAGDRAWIITSTATRTDSRSHLVSVQAR
jgi:hypothetical protein